VRWILAAIARHAVLLLAVALIVAGSAVAAKSVIDGGDVRDGSLTGKDVKDGSLTFRDFQKVFGPGGRGSPGPPGANGVTGPTGPTGPAAPNQSIGPVLPIELETEQVTGTVPSSTVAEKELTVECEKGPVLGGGYAISPDESSVRVVSSYASSADKWLVRAVSSDASAWELTVVAVCAK
jgi:hypothetical protein